MSDHNRKSSTFLRRLFHKNTARDPSNQNKAGNEESILVDYYSSFMENHPDIILLLSLDGKMMSPYTKRLHKHLGYRPKQKVTFKELVTTKDYTKLRSAFQQSVKGKTKRIVFEAISKQEEWIHFIGTFIPIETTTNGTEGILLILEDITLQKQLEKENTLKSSHLEQARQIASIGSWEYTISNDKLECSKSCYDIFGIGETGLFSLDAFLSFIHPEDYDATKAVITNAIKDGKGYSTEFRLIQRKTGEVRDIKVTAEAIKENSLPVKLVGILKDITEYRKLIRETIETNNSYRYIFDNLHVGIWMRESMEGDIIFASKGMEHLLQIPLATLYEKPDYWKGMVLPMHQEGLFEKYKSLKNGERIEHKFRIKAGDGTTKWIYEQTIPRMDGFGKVSHLFGMVTDISTETEMQRKLEFLAKNDALTTLPNQHSLHEKLDELIQEGGTNTFALLNMDLDNFNGMIEHFGHEIGDMVLKRIANRLILSLAETENGFLARMNTDAFILIVPDYKNKEMIFQLAKKIIKTIGKEIMIKGYELHVTASIGISFFPENGDSKSNILKNASTALYHAKQLGKNNYQIYSHNKNISSHKKYMLEKDLRHAIQNEDFEIYYQPQVNTNSGVIEGAEALIRWEHKEWGLVSPGEFIPIAEERHLIHLIGAWTIQTVCEHIQSWREKGLSLYPIAINISPMLFLRPGIVDTVKGALEKHQIPAKYIEFEITESSLLKNEKIVSETIDALKELGIKIALDDFGTGYSSFHYLQHFDLDTIKIDQSFIRNMGFVNKDNTKESTIVSSFLHLAKGLNMKIVAEGVEEYEQLEFLKQKDCNLIQGYLFSKPVTIDKFEQIMETGYLKPNKRRKYIKPEKERRKYFRFIFPDHLPAKMNITEVSKRKVSMGYADILIDNISLGGIRFLSTLRLPINTHIKLNFHFKLMNESFDLNGTLVYKNDEKAELFSYGVSFHITEGERDKLAEVINKMTVLKRQNVKIPDTVFIEGSSFAFFRKQV